MRGWKGATCSRHVSVGLQALNFPPLLSVLVQQLIIEVGGDDPWI
jgi:hypothetical protein